MIIDFLLNLLKFLVISGLIFFIVHNAFNTRNYKRKALIFLLTGLVLLIGMFIAHLVDRYYFNYSVFGLSYYAFPLAVLLLTIITVTISLVMAKKYHHGFSRKPYLKRDKSSENYLYTIYKYRDHYYLKLKKDLYSGDVVKFKKDILFHDQMIDFRIQSLGLSVESADLIGKVNGKDKKKEYNFYCYLVELNGETESLKDFEKIDMFAIQRVKALDFDKNIILRIIIKEKFDVKM